MLDPKKLEAAFSELADNKETTTIEAAADGSSPWVIEKPDVCPDCSKQMRPSMCLDTPILTCFNCRIALPMPNDYKAPENVPVAEEPPTAYGVDRQRVDPLEVLRFVDQNFKLYDAP